MDHLKKHHNHYHHHHSPFNVVRYLFFIISLLSICLLSVSVATNTRTRSTATASLCSDILCPLTTKTHPSIQETEIIKPNKEEMAMGASSARRYLTGPGSSPPRCTSKCGRCTPCKPVHVPVPPGTPVTAEYYPEAWRCKCGNKLYMP